MDVQPQHATAPSNYIAAHFEAASCSGLTQNWARFRTVVPISYLNIKMWENSYSGSFVTKGLEGRSWFGSRDDCGHGLKKTTLIAGREPASSPTDHVQPFTEASIHHRGAPTPDRYDAAAAERCVTCCFGEFDEILCNLFGGQSEIILK